MSKPAYARSGAAIALGVATDPSPLTRAFIDAATSLGIPYRADLNDPDNDGVGLTPLSIRRGRRWSVVDAYLRPVLERPNLELEDRMRRSRRSRSSTVEPSEWCSEGGSDGIVIRAREVILAAGAVGSPALLLRSGVGAATTLAGHRDRARRRSAGRRREPPRPHCQRRDRRDGAGSETLDERRAAPARRALVAHPPRAAQLERCRGGCLRPLGCLAAVTGSRARVRARALPG